MLGITPKIFLHKFAANHKDNTITLKKTAETNITKAGFNCNVENSVAYSPFTYFITATVYRPIINGSSPISFFRNSFFTNHHFYCELRGPPFC